MHFLALRGAIAPVAPLKSAFWRKVIITERTTIQYAQPTVLRIKSNQIKIKSKKVYYTAMNKSN